MTKKKHKSAKKSPRSILLAVIAVAFVAFLLISVAKKASDYNQQKGVLSQKEEVLNQKKDKIAELSSEANNVDEGAVFEEHARKQGYAYPDERLYYDSTPGAND